MNLKTYTLSILFALTLSACGQKGPLVVEGEETDADTDTTQSQVLEADAQLESGQDSK